MLGGMDQGDRRAVAVPDEDRALDGELTQDLREDLAGLLVHEARRARAGRRVGVPVAEAGERHDAAAGAMREIGGERPPEAHGTQALVEEDERRLAAR